MKLLESIKSRARLLKRETLALWFAARDPRTPWYAKVLAITITAYAFSPVDLIPDFIPILGYLDDLILIPAGIALTLKLIPPEIMADARAKADLQALKPVNWWAAALIILVWAITLFFVIRALLPLFVEYN